MASATLNLGSACHVAPGTSLAQPWRTHSLPVLHLGSVSLEPPLQIMRGSGAGTVGALQPRLWRTSTPLCGIARFSSGACVRRPIAVAQKLPGTSVGRARSSDVVPRAAPPQTSLPPAEDAKDVAANQDEAAGDEWPWDWTQGATPEIAFALMFASIPLVPLLPRFQWSASLYFTCLALWAIYVGSHRSLKTRQAQKISLQQSFAVPILCSVTLFGFYCLLRFFPDLDLRSFFGAYLSLVGTLAVGSNLSDPLRKALPQLNDKWSTQIDLPKWVMTEEGQPVHVTLAPTDVLATLVGLGASLGSQQSGAPFTLGNFVAVCIVTELLQLLSLGSFATAAVMLSGLLVYDVFWVFGSSQVFGDNVMVTVATSQALDGPMKLVFPNWNVGTTSSTAVDPIKELGTITEENDMWMHVDAAYAGSALICPEFQHFFVGLENADSFCFNAHKWLLTNFDCSCLWVKESKLLADALSVSPEYLRNKASDSNQVVDYKDWQIPLGRRFRALKLWMVMRLHGAEGLRAYIRTHVDLAKDFEALVMADPRFEIVAPRTFSLVCFRLLPPLGALDNGKALNAALLEAVNASGKIFFTHTVMSGVYTLRMAIGGTRTEKRHVDAAWAAIQSQATHVLASNH